MRTLLLSLAILLTLPDFSGNFSGEGTKKFYIKSRKKIVYRGDKKIQRSVVKKFKPKTHMFIGEGRVNGLNRYTD
ncbi:hypothetical protein [Adhaeribacter soli]|uniref:Uncharacterized protein n=1 Tax=Adhaeribacter soli TaxID=2607655 RepID=A0A5N1J1Z3_9BACT|nr:hypothetical protein [Adhaeribacter soli]KAA9340803.1 hypothetical protein F0P94_05080 [Adhaeribacter soli]